MIREIVNEYTRSKLSLSTKVYTKKKNLANKTIFMIN